MYITLFDWKIQSGNQNNEYSIFFKDIRLVIVCPMAQAYLKLQNVFKWSSFFQEQGDNLID